MEPKFQNTFIPKRPVVTQANKVATAPRRKKTSIIGMLLTLVFIATLLAAGGVFSYTKYLEASISKKDIRLQAEIASLEPELINELAVADAQLRLAEDMLSDHLVPSRFFQYLEDMTLQRVRFIEFSYEGTPGGHPTVEITGLAPDYETVALQSDVFAREENIVSSLFSELSLTDAGNVSFVVTLEISDRLTSYKN